MAGTGFSGWVCRTAGVSYVVLILDVVRDFDFGGGFQAIFGARCEGLASRPGVVQLDLFSVILTFRIFRVACSLWAPLCGRDRFGPVSSRRHLTVVYCLADDQLPPSCLHQVFHQHPRPTEQRRRLLSGGAPPTSDQHIADLNRTRSRRPTLDHRQPLLYVSALVVRSGFHLLFKVLEGVDRILRFPFWVFGSAAFLKFASFGDLDLSVVFWQFLEASG